MDRTNFNKLKKIRKFSGKKYVLLMFVKTKKRAKELADNQRKRYKFPTRVIPVRGGGYALYRCVNK